MNRSAQPTMYSPGILQWYYHRIGTYLDSLYIVTGRLRRDSIDVIIYTYY